jgi:dihydrofolate synthase/folylpolyglutamate synthase
MREIAMFNIDQIQKMAEKHSFFFNQMKMIHVGGTNGKGSVTSMLSHILMQKYRVGLYQSPYDQVRFDNISINLVPISQKEVDDLIQIYQQDFIAFKLSEFEIDTWIALAYFHQMQVDYAVIEVGLGGREDATNIITPILSVITNIGYDHMDVLGSNIKDIAYAKAGIIKKNIPVVLGRHMDLNALLTIESYGEMMQSNRYISDQLTKIEHKPHLQFEYNRQKYALNTIAAYQIDNASIVLKAIEVLDKIGHKIDTEDIKNGFLMPILTKRFEILSEYPLIICDAAHNKEGANALILSLQRLKLKNIVFIVSILKDKPIHEMLDIFLHLTDEVYMTTFEFSRAMDLNTFDHQGVKNIQNIDRIIDMIHQKPNQTYIFTGSLYFLRTIYPIIKGALIHGKK